MSVTLKLVRKNRETLYTSLTFGKHEKISDVIQKVAVMFKLPIGSFCLAYMDKILDNDDNIEGLDGKEVMIYILCNAQ